MNELNHHMSPG